MTFNEGFYTNLLGELYALGFTNAQLLASFGYAQAQHESANFESNVYKQAGNPIGYKQYVGSPYQVNKGAGNYKGYALFSNDAAAAKELAHWYGRRKQSYLPLTSTAAFVNQLKRDNYFEAPIKEYFDDVDYYYRNFPLYGKELKPVKVTAYTSWTFVYIFFASVAAALFVPQSTITGLFKGK